MGNMLPNGHNPWRSWLFTIYPQNPEILDGLGIGKSNFVSQNGNFIGKTGFLER